RRGAGAPAAGHRTGARGVPRRAVRASRAGARAGRESPRRRGARTARPGGGALAEGLFGAGRGIDDFVFLTLSTGLGGGAVVGGRLLRGASGNGAEVG